MIETLKCKPGEGQRETESQVGSSLSMEPKAGFNPMTQSHYWSRNQESDIRKTEPPRCPMDIAFLSDTLISNTTKNSVNLFFKYFKNALFFNIYTFLYILLITTVIILLKTILILSSMTVNFIC